MDTSPQYKRSLLYYPTIHIPSGQWLRQAVLYWDEVGSIVPRDYEGNLLMEYSRDMKSLVDEDIFHPFIPTDFETNWNYDPQLRKITNYLKDDFNKILTHSISVGIIPADEEDKRYYQVHMGKLGDEMLTLLKSKGLASKENPYKGFYRKNDFGWFYIEKTAALLYMSLLANFLSRMDNRVNCLTTPGTDRAEYQNLLFLTQPDKNNEIGIEYQINNWLPIPIGNVPISKIISFKRKRQDELKALQALLIDFEQQVNKAETIEEVKAIAFKFELEKQKGVRDLRACYRDAYIETGWGSLNVLVNLSVAPLVGYFAGKLAEIAAIGNPVTTGVIAFGLSASIALKAYFVSKQAIQNEKLRISPYSYLFHAEKELIIPR